MRRPGSVTGGYAKVSYGRSRPATARTRSPSSCARTAGASPPRWPGASSPTRRGAESSASPRDPASAAATPSPKRPYAVRKPNDYRPTRPGDLVQVDTLDVRPLPGVVLKHFTARDVVSRCDVLQVGTQATSASAARFLDAIVARMPFPVRAIQVDGGSEFQGAFEEACKERGVLLFGAAAAFAEVERLRGARPPDARRGVLQLLRRGVDDGAVEPRAAVVGGAFLYENRRQSLVWLSPRNILRGSARRRPPNPLLSQYAPNERNPLPSPND